ncbi:hypothetical protein LINPERPRIM_LOCUS18064 [Linum perenne]
MSGDDMTPDLHPLTVGLLFGDARDPAHLLTRRTTLPMIGTEEHDTLTVLFLEVPHLQGEGGEAPGEAIQEVSPVAQEGSREEATRPVFLQSLEGGQVDDILATVSPVAREGATHEVFLQKREEAPGRVHHLLDEAILWTAIRGVLAQMLVLDRCLGL